MSEYQSNGYLRLSDWNNFGQTSGIAYICHFAADKIVQGSTEQDYLQFSKGQQSLTINLLSHALDYHVLQPSSLIFRFLKTVKKIW